MKRSRSEIFLVGDKVSTSISKAVRAEVRRALLIEVSKSPQLEANHLCSHALLGTSYEDWDVISPRRLLRRSLTSIWIFCEEKYRSFSGERVLLT